MKLEEAKKELKHIVNFKNDTGFAYSQKNTSILQKAIETVLQELENCISKDKVREKISELKQTPRKEFCNYNDYTYGSIRALEELLEDK